MACDTFFGATLSTGALSVTAQILGGSRQGLSCEDIDCTHAGTTGDNKSFDPADLNDGGTYNFDIIHDANIDWDNKVGTAATFIVTYPTPAGGMTGATKTFNGYINGYDEQLPIFDKMTGSLSIKVAGDVTHVSST